MRVLLKRRTLLDAPPILSFRLAEKKECAAPGVRKKRAPDADDISGIGTLLSRITDIPVIRSERRWLSHASVRAQRCKC